MTLLPLIIPADRPRLRLYPALQHVLVPAAAPARAFGTDILLTFAYVTLGLPYMYRAVDTGMRTIDVADADRGGDDPRAPNQ